MSMLFARASLIQELKWRLQSALGRPAGAIDPAQEITFRFYDDERQRG
jgi:hypothetical protein